MQRYQGQTVAFLTQHGKESLVRPVLEPALGCTVQRAEGYDTDLLGTFSGEVKRIEGQLQTARTKARIGMQLLGTPLGMASEGAVVPDDAIHDVRVLERFTFVDLDDALVQHRWKDDVAGEYLRPRLVADLQGIAEAGGRDQRGPRAPHLQDGV